MKAAIEFAAWRDQLAKPRRSTDAWYKMAGLAVAVGFPTLFWVTALGLLAKSLGMAMSVAALASIGLVIAAIAFVGAVVATAEARLK
jgi:uncharacterized membrane protein